MVATMRLLVLMPNMEAQEAAVAGEQPLGRRRLVAVLSLVQAAVVVVATILGLTAAQVAEVVVGEQ